MAIGATGSLLLGVLLMLVGSLLLTGASLGAILRRSGRGIHHAARKARSRSHAVGSPVARAGRRRPSALRRRSPRRSTPSRRSPTSSGRAATTAVRRRAAGSAPDRAAGAARGSADALRRGDVGARRVQAPRRRRPPDLAGARRRLGRDHGARCRAARPDARAFRRRGDGDRPDLGPARDALRAPARAGDEGRQGRGAEGRPLVRARHDRDPHPRADSRQAGGRCRASEPFAEPRHARRHLRADPGDGEPGRGLARQGHLRCRRLDRPRTHAASAHRGHHRFGQVGLPQRGPHVRPSARDARRRAPDPDRPEADRAQPLRVGAAPAHSRRLEPEGGERRPRQLPGRDGAPLRAPRDRPRPQPQRGKSRLPPARRADPSRTCWS